MFAWLRIAGSRVSAFFAARRLNREFDHELEIHLSMLTDKFVREGMPREEAMYAARRQFGGITQVKQDRVERRGLPHVDAFFQDVRYALRTLYKAPAFSATALAAL